MIAQPPRIVGLMAINRREFLGVASSAAGYVGLEPSRSAGFDIDARLKASRSSEGAIAADDDPLGVRQDFPVTRESLYLNSAYITPVPAPVAAAGRAFADRKMSSPILLDEML